MQARRSIWIVVGLFWVLLLVISSCGGLRERLVEVTAFDTSSADPALSHYLQGKLLAKHEQYAAAQAHYHKALAKDSEAYWVRLQLARVQQQQGQWQTACNTLQPVLEARPQWEQAWKIAVNCALQAQKPQLAREQLQQAIAAYPQKVSYYLWLSRLYQRQDKPQEAVAVLKQALAARPDSVMAELALARLYMQQNKQGLAAASLERVLVLKPDMVPAYLQLGRIYQQQNRLEDAQEIYSRLLEEQPKQQQGWQRLIDVLISRQNWSRAQQELQAYLKLHPQDGQAWFQLGIVAMEQQQWPLAVDALETAREEYSQAPEVLFSLGLALEQVGETQGAIKSYQKIDSSAELYGQSRLRLSDLLWQQDRRQEAAAVIAKAMDVLGDNPQHYMYLADLYRRLDRHQKALQTLKQGRQRHADAVDLLYQQAVIHELAGEQKQARQILQQVLAQQPEHTEALNHLAYSYALEGIHLQKALQMARQALAHKDLPHIRDTVAWVLFQLGRPQEALQQLEQAVAAIPEDPEVQFHLGRIYQKLGQTDKACRHYQKALNLGFRHPEKVHQFQKGLACQ